MTGRARFVASVVASVVLIALIAAGCSKSSDHSTPASSTTSVAPNGTRATGPTSTLTPGSSNPPTTASTPASRPPATNVSSHRLPPVGVGVEVPLTPRAIFVTVTRIKAQTLGARGPTETSGPGVIVTLEVRNVTDTPFDLDGLAINAHYGHGVPALPNHVPGEPLVGMLAPGQRKSGLYEFRIAKGAENTVVIDIEHASAPNVVIVDNVH
jgi:hypothetical protein